MDNFSYILGFVILVVIGSVFYSLYVKIITRKNKAEEAWADIDVELKKRYDLVPNLVSVAKKYMDHEQET